jgi:hypothetical protein
LSFPSEPASLGFARVSELLGYLEKNGIPLREDWKEAKERHYASFEHYKLQSKSRGKVEDDLNTRLLQHYTPGRYRLLRVKCGREAWLEQIFKQEVLKEQRSFVSCLQKVLEIISKQRANIS